MPLINQSINQTHKYAFRYTDKWRGCLRGVMVKAMDSVIVKSEFELHSRYYVHFRANTLILPAMG